MYVYAVTVRSEGSIVQQAFFTQKGASEEWVNEWKRKDVLRIYYYEIEEKTIVVS